MRPAACRPRSSGPPVAPSAPLTRALRLLRCSSLHRCRGPWSVAGQLLSRCPCPRHLREGNVRPCKSAHVPVATLPPSAFPGERVGRSGEVHRATPGAGTSATCLVQCSAVQGMRAACAILAHPRLATLSRRDPRRAWRPLTAPCPVSSRRRFFRAGPAPAPSLGPAVRSPCTAKPSSPRASSEGGAACTTRLASPSSVSPARHHQLISPCLPS